MSQTGGQNVPTFPPFSANQPLVPERGEGSVPTETIDPLLSSVFAQDPQMSNFGPGFGESLDLGKQWRVLSGIPTEAPAQVGIHGYDLGGININGNNHQGTLFNGGEHKRQQGIKKAQEELGGMQSARNIDESPAQIQRDLAERDFQAGLGNQISASAEKKAAELYVKEEASEILQVRQQLKQITVKNKTHSQADAVPTAESNNLRPDKSWLSLLHRALLSQIIFKRRKQANAAQMAADRRAKKKQMRGMFLEAQVQKADMASMIENIDPLERDPGES